MQNYENHYTVYCNSPVRTSYQMRDYSKLNRQHYDQHLNLH